MSAIDTGAMRIGGLAQLTGVPVDTIRYYERAGLLPPATRVRTGHRVYATDDVRRLRFIRRAKSLGFSLEEIGSLLALWQAPGGAERMRVSAAAQLLVVNGRLAQLHRLQRAIAGLLEHDATRGPLASCPIVDALTSPFDAALD